MEWFAVILAPCAIVTMYILYQRGIMPVVSKRALMFVGRGMYASDRCGASFTSCTGTVRKAVSCREGGSYRFSLEVALSKGEVSAVLAGPKGLCLLTLDEKTPSARYHLEKGGHYRILLVMKSASGSCMLHWERES